MIWFKFFTGTFRSKGVSKLFEYGGWSYYARWVHLKCIIAEQMDYKTDMCHVEYSPKKWGELLGFKQKKLKTFLKYCENVLETNVKYSENIIKIEIPKLLKERDHRKRASGIVQESNLFNTALEELEEEDKDKDLKEKEQKEKEKLKRPEAKAEIEDLDFIKKVLENLNAVAGKKYTHKTAETCKHIRARKNDGATLEDFYTVNRKKTAEWKGTDYEKFLRPSTLYLPSKFESYLNAPEKGATVQLAERNRPLTQAERSYDCIQKLIKKEQDKKRVINNGNGHGKLFENNRDIIDVRSGD